MMSSFNREQWVLHILALVFFAAAAFACVWNGVVTIQSGYIFEGIMLIGTSLTFVGLGGLFDMHRWMHK